MGDDRLQTSSTATGLQIAAEQYSNLFVWLNEYDEVEGAVDAAKLAVVHAGFNRETSSKWIASGNMRKMRTNFLITGEKTCSKASTRSRYVHVQCSRTSWPDGQNHYEWFQRNRKFFFLIYRRLLMKRPEYTRLVGKHLKAWLNHEIWRSVKGSERTKSVHGIAFAGYAAARELLVGDPPRVLAQHLEEVRLQVVKHCGHRSSISPAISTSTGCGRMRCRWWTGGSARICTRFSRRRW